LGIGPIRCFPAMERAPLLPAGGSSIAPSWPVVQPPEPPYSSLSDCQTCLRCPSAYGCGGCRIPCYAILGLVLFAIMMALYPVLVSLVLLALVIFGWLLGYVLVYLFCLTPPPELVWKGAKLVQLSRLTFYEMPKPSEWKVSDLKPKSKLATGLLQYAIAVRVPFLSEDELFAGGLFESLMRLAPNSEFMTSSSFFSIVPDVTSFSSFKEGENPVQYVMDVCRDIYPKVIQEWVDKTSDRALTHLCLHGLGAHRLERADIKQHPDSCFVVRTNQLAALPVRDGYEHYGNDVYFDASFRVVKIVRAEQVEAWEAPRETTYYPDGSRDWEYAKFCFRSSLFSLVTLVDHLYGCHLQLANVVVQAMREQLSVDHPVRRFLVPFSYGTININDLARQTLVTRDSFLPRLVSLDNEGLQLAWASAYKLLPAEYLASESEGPIAFMESLFDREKMIQQKREQGMFTQYYQQSLEYWKIVKKFVSSYLDHYYGVGEKGDLALAADEEMKRFLLQTVTLMQNFSDPLSQGSVQDLWPSVVPFRKKEIMVNFLTRFCELVTVGHEQAGAVQAYAQDGSFCAFSWAKTLRKEGTLAAPREIALGAALLMALTSTPMPRLLVQKPEDDWSHLFPAASDADRASLTKIFEDFQSELRRFSGECDAWNAATKERSFPNDFGLWTFNPKYLETSVSI